VTEWWKTGVVYQVYPRSYQDTTGNGVGDLNGVRSRLGYLADVLGVDAIWLSPFYPSPMDDFGYDVADYCDVDPLFGTLDDFDRLLADAHGRGLKIIIDFVPNHTSDRHPWFRAARSSRADPKRDWYVWADPKPDGSPPNNWRAAFGGRSWEWDEPTGQYYLHSFLPSQADLNWRNPEVERAMFDVLRFWLDRGVDGFRVDVAHFIMKDPEMRDNPERADAPAGASDYERYHHLNDLGHPDAHVVYRRMRGLLDGYRPERVSIGEIHFDDIGKWAAYYGSGTDEFHLPFNFRMLNAPWEASVFRELVDQLEGALPEGAWPNYVLGNHDETRLATRYGPNRARPAAMLLLTLRGTPTLYQGDELGMEEVVVALDRTRDPWGFRVPGSGRDGCRTPMQWAPGAGAGFTDPGVEPWLPFGPDAAVRNVAALVDDPRSILNLYRALLEVRRASPALREGSYRPLDDGIPDGCLGYRREHDGGAAMTVLINFGPGFVEVSGVEPGTVLVSTGLDRDGERVGGSVSVAPDEGLLVGHHG
jgi:alpha-glucosidase